jgi:zinc D-Ala-D-Ala dipeptidase
MSFNPVTGATRSFSCMRPHPLVPKFDVYAGWQEIFQTFESILPYPTHSLIKSQYLAFRSHSLPTIADERMKSIPIHENNEELVDIKTMDHQRISMLPDPQKPFEGALFNSGLPKASKLRKGVFLRLEKMVDALDNLAPYFGYQPGQISIKVFEGLRDLTTQAKIFQAKFDEIQKKSPEMTRDEIERETAKWVSPVRNNVPVHSTGAAVDIRLWDNDKNDFLDVGSFGVLWGATEDAPTFSETGTLSIQQKLNRFLCVAAANQAGLTNYLFEHWHYSYGDRYDAYWHQNNPESRNAIYGSVV